VQWQRHCQPEGCIVCGGQALLERIMRVCADSACCALQSAVLYAVQPAMHPDHACVGLCMCTPAFTALSYCRDSLILGCQAGAHHHVRCLHLPQACRRHHCAVTAVPGCLCRALQRNMVVRAVLGIGVYIARQCAMLGVCTSRDDDVATWHTPVPV
jgi:hypothetical protein